MTEFTVRFVAGGILVSIFALLGDILRPKSFAGLLGAAPSVAIVSLALGIFSHGSEYAVTQARFMISGAIALLTFSIATCHLLKRADLSAITSTLFALPIWLIVAFGLYAMGA